MSNYTLPPLNYAYDALEPHIDAQTMEIHYTKHHQAYVNNLNAALKDTPHGSQPVEQLIADLSLLPEGVRGAVRNNGGGHANHSLFWTVMAPADQGGGGAPSGELGQAIDRELGASMPSKPPSPRPRSRALAAAGRGSWWARTASWPWKAAATRTAR